MAFDFKWDHDGDSDGLDTHHCAGLIALVALGGLVVLRHGFRP